MVFSSRKGVLAPLKLQPYGSIQICSLLNLKSPSASKRASSYMYEQQNAKPLRAS